MKCVQINVVKSMLGFLGLAGEKSEHLIEFPLLGFLLGRGSLIFM